MQGNPAASAFFTGDCAICEIILRCPDAPARIDPATGLPALRIVYPSDFKAYSYSQITTTRVLKLVDLTTFGQRVIGVDQNALLAGPKSTYPETRKWAEAIHAANPDAQGLYYTSFQFGPEFAVVLFGDRVPDGTLTPGTKVSVADAAHHSMIEALANKLSIEYADV